MVRLKETSRRNAAIEAARMVRDGMVLGLGTGSTVQHFLSELSRRIDDEGLRILGVPTSTATLGLAKSLGIPLTSLDEHQKLDMDVDGADQVDPDLNLIKGGGGAHVREKIVAKASDRVVIIVDESKLVERLGTGFPVPVEVVPFGLAPARRELSELGAIPRLRTTGGKARFRTDNGNLILDCDFGPIDDPAHLESRIKAVCGVVDSGIFAGLTDTVIVGTETGCRRMRRPS